MGSQLPVWPGNPGNPAKSPQVAGKKADTVTMRTSVEKEEERNHL